MDESFLILSEHGQYDRIHEQEKIMETSTSLNTQHQVITLMLFTYKMLLCLQNMMICSLMLIIQIHIGQGTFHQDHMIRNILEELHKIIMLLLDSLPDKC